MNLDNEYEHFSKVYTHKNSIDELLSLKWLANLIGSEKCKNDIMEQLNMEKEALLTYFKQFAKYCKKSESCLMGYAIKLNLQENFNSQEKPKIFLKK